MSYFSKISYDDTGAIDAFSRLRTSTPEQLFAVQCQYNRATIQMEPGNTGTGVAPAHDANTRMVALSATAGSGVSFMQSYQYSPYIPGKSQFIAMTGVLGTGVAGAVVDYGYGDAANGVFYRQDGASGLQVVLRTSTSGSPAETVAAQASWNLDKMDGTGISGKTLEVTKCFILIIDLQFLGMGRVRIGFDIDGVVYYVHQFLNTNVLTLPYMQSATLPVSIVLTATTTAAPKTCYFKCAAIQSEGGFLNVQGYQSVTPEATVTAGSGADTHILSIRPKTTFNGIVNRELFELDNINIIVTGSNPVQWKLVLGATFSGAPTWADVNTSYSAFEYATGGTLSGSGTVTIASGYVSSSAQSKGAIDAKVNVHYPIALNRAGANFANGTLTLLVNGIGGTSATRASFGFIEVR